MSEASSSATKAPEWRDDIDCNINEACRLYGFDGLEGGTRDKQAAGTDDDASISSEESDKNPVKLQDRVDSQLYVSREADGGKTLWKVPMNESDALADHIAATKKQSYRLPCHSFRSMLPPLRERPPVRSMPWLRSCMRGVLFSYLKNQPLGQRLRFPEHVHCWFAEGESPDEDRWAFFYALKSLAESNPECWLTFALLDDMQGQDFDQFLARAIESLQNQMERLLDDQIDETAESSSRLIGALQIEGHSLEDEQACAANIWIPVASCKDLVGSLFGGEHKSDSLEELFSNATEASDEAGSSSSLSVDLFSFIQVTMQEYLVRKKRHMTLIRLMFDTAAKGVLTDFYDAQPSGPIEEGLIGVPQLDQILKTIMPSATLKVTASVYREAYDALYPPSQWGQPAPDGINFQSFCIAVERLSLFSKMEIANS